MKPITIISCILCILLLGSCAASKNMEKLSNLKLENKTVYLSMPDSTGKQYPIKQSTTNINKQDTEHTESAETLSISISQISSKLDSLYQRVNELCKSSGKTIELSWWDLHKDKIYLSAIITMLITIFLVKIKKSYHL